MGDAIPIGSDDVHGHSPPACPQAQSLAALALLRVGTITSALGGVGAGQTVTPIGWSPTVMGADTAPVAVVITDTVLSPVLAT